MGALAPRHGSSRWYRGIGHEVPIDPEGDALYLDASDDAALAAALEAIAGDICRGRLL